MTFNAAKRNYGNYLVLLVVPPLVGFEVVDQDDELLARLLPLQFGTECRSQAKPADADRVVLKLPNQLKRVVLNRMPSLSCPPFVPMTD